MKVGTDGVLLGAWVNVANRYRALDVGTGSGLISLMLAQRNCSLIVDAIEIDKSAARQAAENVFNSKYNAQVRVICEDFLTFADSALQKYDLIVSNPPFFSDSLKAPSQQRTMARHDESLNFEDLLRCCISLLSRDGIVALIYPSELMQRILIFAESIGLFPVRVCQVFPKPGSAPKRVLIELSLNQGNKLESSSLVIEVGRHVYSEEFTLLTRDFYLDKT